MKLTKRFKLIVLSSFLLLYTSGVATWVLSRWFLINSGLGPEASPFRLWWLQVHGIISLWFLILFGYLFHAHVMVSWRRGKKRRSGSILTGTLIFLIATVPGLYYVANESLKNQVAWLHTYVGLATIAILVLHLRDKGERDEHPIQPSGRRTRARPRRLQR